MARNDTLAAAPIEVAWSVLADPRQYSRFVVGTKRVRRFDPTWPEPGAALHHSVGIGPFLFRDATRVIEALRTTRLHLHAGLGPLGVSRITLTLEALSPNETRLVIEEHPASGPLRTLWNPVFDSLMWLRNVELVRRLRRIAEHRAITTTAGTAAPEADGHTPAAADGEP